MPVAGRSDRARGFPSSPSCRMSARLAAGATYRRAVAPGHSVLRVCSDSVGRQRVSCR